MMLIDNFLDVTCNFANGLVAHERKVLGLTREIVECDERVPRAVHLRRSWEWWAASGAHRAF